MVSTPIGLAGSPCIANNEKPPTLDESRYVIETKHPFDWSCGFELWIVRDVRTGGRFMCVSEGTGLRRLSGTERPPRVLDWEEGQR